MFAEPGKKETVADVVFRFRLRLRLRLPPSEK
jgi:hypothetical protein